MNTANTSPRQLIGFIFAAALALVMGAAVATEQPSYKVLAQQDDFELRQYSSMIVAQSTVTGTMDDASGTGFRAVADYIFGNNTSASGGSEEISMTAPVLISPQAIASGSPATNQLASSPAMEDESGQWVIGFVMPSKFSLDTLPEPNSNKVVVSQVPARTMAVVTFSGLTGEDKVATKTQQLLAWMAENNLTPISAPKLARYNPPWTLPFFRRNEVMIEY
ncbi:heme-binding protein [Neiella marina]|uniref:Heme-binding protein n=1 Tax=Neiella marina TaxID=508461 RepID=A0A8J2U744_9GAMM|nr:heme-binding protein [Neiella marina]GGA83553.1 heme-binding protein [Neiella marina]